MCGKKKALRGIGLLVASLAAALLTQAVPVQAATGINKQLTFQGKVVNSSGVNLADGTYDMEFKIYQDGNSSGTGSTLMWTEDYLVSGSTGMPSTGGIVVSSGTFNVNLGSICALGGGTCGAKTNTGVDFNQDTLWLSFQVGNTSSCTVTSSTTSFHTACGGDGEMTPFIRLTAVPQAFNSDKVGGLTASQLVQLSPGSPQSGNISLTTGNSVTAGTVNANTLDAASSGALTVGSSNATSISLAKNTTLSSGLTMTLQGNNALTLGSTTNAGGILFQDGTSNNRTVTLTTPGLTNSYSVTWAATGASGTQCLQSTSGSTTTVTLLQWGTCGGGMTLAAVDSAGSANANGATITGSVLNLNSADATHPGVINATTQTFGGNKTFNGTLTVANTALIQTPTNSATAFQVQDTNSKSVATVDTSNGKLILGDQSASGVTGKLQFNTANNSNSVSIQAGATAASGYTLTLPTALPGSTQCLQSSSSGTLSFTTCATNLQTAYNTSTDPEITLGSASTAGLSLRDNATPISGNLFEVQNNGGTKSFFSVSATGLLAQNASANAMQFLNTGGLNGAPELKVFGSGGSNYATISYNDSTSSAIFGASSGTTQIGTGTGSGGDINLLLSNEPDKLVATKNGTLTATYTSSNFAFIRNVTAGSFAAQGNVVKIEDTSSVGSGSLSPNLLYINQNSATATGNLILAQTGGNTTKFQVDTTGTVTIASGQSYTGLGALTLQSASASALNVTSGTTGVLTLDSGTTGAVNIGTGSNAKTITVGNTTGATGLTLQAGSGNITVGAASITGTGALAIDSASGTALNVGTGANAHNVTIGNTTGASATTIQGGSGDIIINTSAGNNVVIGSATTDTNMVLLQPDSYSTYDDSGVSCTTTNNQGAFYYNTASGSLRTCRSSGWEDVVTTAALGLQLFGVVPDSGSNPGDLAGIVSGGGPCQVSWTAVNSVSVNSCVAYSGGRKVIVQSTSFSSLTGTVGQFRHICLNGTDNQPALSAAGTETANLPTWSVTAPVLCLADIKFGGTNTMASGGLYDLRTYTTTNKTFTTVNAAVPYGTMIIGTGTAGQHAQSSATLGLPAGVVVASSGVAQTAAINVIYAYSGPTSVKATAGSLNAKVQTTTTAGYAITGTSTTLGQVAGFSQNAWSNTCTSAANCQSSLFFLFSPR
ncbi:MAG TPA: hypothetical protein VLG13_03625 [Patescibacteria group bacterium]|nr:hypothetical protein [Patescibacteria group bacterium]